MYFPMELKHNPSAKDDIDAERERREEMLSELKSGMASSKEECEDDDDETFSAEPSEELEALLPYYNQVEEEALKIAKRYFRGSFIADSKNVHGQKLFEYELRGHTYRCYVDIYNENEDEINIIEVKATTNSKFRMKPGKDGKIEGLWYSEKRGAEKFPLFVKTGNIWKLADDSVLNDEAKKSYDTKKAKLLSRYSDEGKYPHDIAFQKFVIDHALKQAGDKRPVHYYLAVLNSEYVYDGARDSAGHAEYNAVNGQELVTFYDMDRIAEEYQSSVEKEIATLESYILTLHDTGKTVPVGEWCAWKKNTECIFYKHCFEKLRKVPEYNKANNYISFRSFKAGVINNKYQLINEGYWKFDDVPAEWLDKDNHKIQRECYDSGDEYVAKDKMQFWLDKIEYPIYHFDFESFPCPLPRFKGEVPYRQSVFEFSLHIERKPGVCDKQEDNFIFLNRNSDDDERRDLAKAIVDHFEFNEDGTLRGTMLAQNTSFERGRLEELAEIYPEYRDRLLAIRDKSADLIHLLKTQKDFYKAAFPNTFDTINYYNKDLSGSYSIKKTLPVLVPSLTYKGMNVGNGVQAYIAYLNYDSPAPTFNTLRTKTERRAALSLYCQQDTWAMVEILRAVRNKI